VLNNPTEAPIEASEQLVLVADEPSTVARGSGARSVRGLIRPKF
jgi:hypothetical protein